MMIKILILLSLSCSLFADFKVIRVTKLSKGMTIVIEDLAGDKQLEPHEYLENQDGVLIKGIVSPMDSNDGKKLYRIKTNSISVISEGDILKINTPKISESSSTPSVDPFWLIPIGVAWKAGALLDSSWAGSIEVGLFDSGNIRVDYLSSSKNGTVREFSYNINTTSLDMGYVHFFKQRFAGLFVGGYLLFGEVVASVSDPQKRFDRTSKLYYGIGAKVGYRWNANHFFFAFGLSPSYAKSTLQFDTPVIRDVAVPYRKKFQIGYEDLINIGFVF